MADRTKAAPARTPRDRVEKLAVELARHLDLTEEGEEMVRGVKDNVDNVNNQLEGVEESLANLRHDVDNRTEVASKELYEAAHHLDALFAKIDNLEHFVNVVKQTVNDVTDRVDDAESYLTNPINRVWDTLKLNTTRSIEPSDMNLPDMKPFNIFRTEDYFPSSEQT